MKYDAVIFDLFGTLIDYLPVSEWQKAHEQIARILSVDYEPYRKAWREIMPNRDLGKHGGIEGDIKQACALVGVEPTRQQIDEIVEARLDYTRREVQPRLGAVQTLRGLRESGLKVGLITVCGDEVPLIWDETPFAALMDDCIFSCREGITKPDPEIYHLSCKRLGVQPEKCLYVGDGSSRELTGAQEAGMHPVLIQMDYDRDYGVDRIDAIEWQGDKIDCLNVILDLIKD